MRIPIYQIDTFTRRVFGGNPAAVCPLAAWLSDDQMQQIAAENNLSETAFLVPEGQGYRLRWFTPQIEVDLCGHATLASAFVVFAHLDPTASLVRFATASGELVVEQRAEGRLAMNFPSRPPHPWDEAKALVAQALGQAPQTLWRAKKGLAVFGSEAEVRAIRPDFERIRQLQTDGLIVTAVGHACDFVSRYFAPHVGIPEDPVTGSAHCTLIPYWAKRLNKSALSAWQVSARGGELFCQDLGERVEIAGHAVEYLQGSLSL